ncbi:MAG TPA: hypothetical protein VHC19_05215 [Pirellulales bacterium]|jgi:hypothetical protein|nr:hypothetical protein [Pirellulales bacterium]
MDARWRPAKAAMVFAVATTVASGSGCNPLGWGISHVKSLIHHHAHKPIVRDIDERPHAPAVRSPAVIGEEKRTA